MVGTSPSRRTPSRSSTGWYRTGDVGTVDAAGWVSITDRVKEMIKVNGFQVAPAEVEGVLLEPSGGDRLRRLRVPDPRFGEAVVGAVVLSASAEVGADELRELVAGQLASYKCVKHVLFLDQIPRLPSGKVLQARAQVWPRG